MKKILVLATLILFMTGCAHRTEQAVSQKVQQEQPLRNERDLQSRMDQELQRSSLNAAQKAEIYKLREATRQDQSALHDESLRLRSVLAKEMLSPHYNRNEVQVLQKKLRKNEMRQLSLVFDSVEKVNKIIGRETDLEFRQRMMDEMFMPWEMGQPRSLQ